MIHCQQKFKKGLGFMKKILNVLLSFFLIAALLLPGALEARAYEMGQPFRQDLSTWIKNGQRRIYVEMMLDHYIRTDTMIQQALEGGFSAVFLFDGCSDNMDDPELSDLSYYRVSGVCLGLKLDEAGKPILIYFNDNCSTIPDRPLEYGAWEFEEFGDVGPATVCDGTYQIYSVKHGGVYEALHMRDSYRDAELEAVYMISEGYVVKDATQINIHTRTGNHVIQPGMWSAGCMLVGDGDWGQFEELMESTYYSVYDWFRRNLRVGSVTINRQYLRQELLTLYESQGAVETILAGSEGSDPQRYLEACTPAEWEEGQKLRTLRPAKLMTLPCSTGTDCRSLLVDQLDKNEKVEVLGACINSEGNLWYEVLHKGECCYIFSGDLEEIPWRTWFGSVMDALFG